MVGVSPVPRSRCPCSSSSARSGAEVVDLAVEDGDDDAVLVRDRLIAGREVDHAQPPVAERAAAERGGRSVIRATMPNRVARHLDRRTVDKGARKQSRLRRKFRTCDKG